MLLLSMRQKEFLPRDGMAENTFIIEQLIKSAHCTGQEGRSLLGIYGHCKSVRFMGAFKSPASCGEDWDSRISDGIYILCVTRNPRSSEKKIRQTMGI